MTMRYLILISSIIQFHCYGYSNYFNIIDELSFNLKNYNTSRAIYDHYNRDGNVIVYKDYLILSPKLNNSHSFFYSPHQINSTTSEIHFSFTLSPQINYGSAFAFWIFNNSLSFLTNSERNRTFLGFTPDYSGLGVFFITPPVSDPLKYKTHVYFKYNNGTDKHQDLGLNSFTPYNSCFKSLNMIKLVRIVCKKTTTSIFFKDSTNINSECVLNLRKVIEKPFRIGFSTFNGVMDNMTFMDSIHIEKVVVINSDEDSKNTSLIRNRNDILVGDLESSAKDLISNFKINDKSPKINLFSLDLDFVYLQFIRTLEEFNENNDEMDSSCISIAYKKIISIIQNDISKKFADKFDTILSKFICTIKKIRESLIKFENDNYLSIFNKRENLLGLKLTLAKYDNNRLLSPILDILYTKLKNYFNL